MGDSHCGVGLVNKRLQCHVICRPHLGITGLDSTDNPVPVRERRPWSHHQHLRTMRFGSIAKVLGECKLKCYRTSECCVRCSKILQGTALQLNLRYSIDSCRLTCIHERKAGLATLPCLQGSWILPPSLHSHHAQLSIPICPMALQRRQEGVPCKADCKMSQGRRGALPTYSKMPHNPGRQRTMRFGSTAKVLAKCMLKYYSISECSAMKVDCAQQSRVTCFACP